VLLDGLAPFKVGGHAGSFLWGELRIPQRD